MQGQYSNKSMMEIKPVDYADRIGHFGGLQYLAVVQNLCGPAPLNLQLEFIKHKPRTSDVSVVVLCCVVQRYFIFPNNNCLCCCV